MPRLMNTSPPSPLSGTLDSRDFTGSKDRPRPANWAVQITVVALARVVISRVATVVGSCAGTDLRKSRLGIVHMFPGLHLHRGARGVLRRSGSPGRGES
eukprot:scaffold58915_cov118-Phaeocystis_antarctica.AAC.1